MLALVIIDVVIIGLYMIIEGARGSLVVKKVLNREHPEEIVGVSMYTHHPSSQGWISGCPLLHVYTNEKTFH